MPGTSMKAVLPLRSCQDLHVGMCGRERGCVCAESSTEGLTCDAIGFFKGGCVIKRMVASSPEGLFFWIGVGDIGLVSHWMLPIARMLLCISARECYDRAVRILRAKIVIIRE